MPYETLAFPLPPAGKSCLACTLPLPPRCVGLYAVGVNEHRIGRSVKGQEYQACYVRDISHAICPRIHEYRAECHGKDPPGGRSVGGRGASINRVPTVPSLTSNPFATYLPIPEHSCH